MNIQINCNDNVDEYDLRYIYHNLKSLIKEYEEHKNDIKYKKYINGKSTYCKQLDNNILKTKMNIFMTCNGKTMYFKIR